MQGLSGVLGLKLKFRDRFGKGFYREVLGAPGTGKGVKLSKRRHPKNEGEVFFFFLVLSSPGPPVLWSPGPPVLLSPGPLVLRSSGPLVPWSSGLVVVLVVAAGCESKKHTEGFRIIISNFHTLGFELKISSFDT